MTDLQQLLKHFRLTTQSLQQLLEHNRLTTPNFQQLSEQNRLTTQGVQQLLGQNKLSEQTLQRLIKYHQSKTQGLQQPINHGQPAKPREQRRQKKQSEQGLKNGVLSYCSFRGCPFPGTMKAGDLRIHYRTCHTGDGFSTFHCSEKSCWNSEYPNGFRTRIQVLRHAQLFHKEVSTSVNVSQ